MPKLSVVATPIGNLEDITLRALRVLKEADIIACEDTRVTKKLLSHYGIHTPTVSFHSNSGKKGFEKILTLLDEGKHVALVSDAGAPGVSDPGLELVSVVREHFSSHLLSQNPSFKKSSGLRPSDGQTFIKKNFAPDVKIEAIPGASALVAAISIAGLRAPSFTFYGFLPQKKGREKLLQEISASPRSSIFFESPHRILKMLSVLVKHQQPPSRRLGLFRELTKLYEEAITGTPAEVLAQLENNPQKQRGEFVVIVEAAE